MWVRNITGLNVEGTFRSLNGAADENTFIGRATKAGFYCFFKVWRDMPYDAVLSYRNILYRVEVKGSGTSSFNLTRGSRSGAQINRDVENRTRIIDREDCDFVVGVDSDNGDCFIIPVDFIQIVGRNSLSKTALNIFKEKWFLFMGGRLPLDLAKTRDGLLSLDNQELREFANQLNITIPDGPLTLNSIRDRAINDEREKLIIEIWRALAT